MTCSQNKEVKILKSNAGYYIGTAKNGAPCCRLTGYFNAESDAQYAMLATAFDRAGCGENMFCNGGKPCAFKAA